MKHPKRIAVREVLVNNVLTSAVLLLGEGSETGNFLLKTVSGKASVNGPNVKSYRLSYAGKVSKELIEEIKTRSINSEKSKDLSCLCNVLWQLAGMEVESNPKLSQAQDIPFSEMAVTEDERDFPKE